MKLSIKDVKYLLDSEMVVLSKIPMKKGSQIVFYKGKGLYVWKSEDTIFFQARYFFNKRYKFKISNIS